MKAYTPLLIGMEATITINKSGRTVLPMRIRKRLETSRFGLKVPENEIELMPANSLESLFGAFPDLDVERIRREHEDEIKNKRF